MASHPPSSKSGAAWPASRSGSGANGVAEFVSAEILHSPFSERRTASSAGRRVCPATVISTSSGAITGTREAGFRAGRYGSGAAPSASAQMPRIVARIRAFGALGMGLVFPGVLLACG